MFASWYNVLCLVETTYLLHAVCLYTGIALPVDSKGLLLQEHSSVFLLFCATLDT